MDRGYPQAGNWKKFDSFCWSRAYDGSIENPDDWCIYYTRNRDSGLLDQSNAAYIDKALADFPETDCIAEQHTHWLCGWVEGYVIRVRTPAYEALCRIIDRLDNYPVLDESDYSDREWEATWDNLIQSLCDTTRHSDWEGCYPIDLPERVKDWLDDNEPNWSESTNDRGGYPDDDSVSQAVEESVGQWLADDCEWKDHPTLFAV